MEITCVTIDCRDPAKVATFWNEALGWGGIAVAADGTGAICGPAGGGLYLEFIVVPEDAPMMLHPGVATLAIWRGAVSWGFAGVGGGVRGGSVVGPWSIGGGHGCAGGAAGGR